MCVIVWGRVFAGWGGFCSKVVCSQPLFGDSCVAPAPDRFCPGFHCFLRAGRRRFWPTPARSADSQVPRGAAVAVQCMALHRDDLSARHAAQMKACDALTPRQAARRQSCFIAGPSRGPWRMMMMVSNEDIISRQGLLSVGHRSRLLCTLILPAAGA